MWIVWIWVAPSGLGRRGIEALVTRCFSFAKGSKSNSPRIRARVEGDWHDPHNGGQYSLLQNSSSRLDLQRVTGNKLFTDKMILEFMPVLSTCKVTGCSESQIFSLADASTNYCNLRNLYCGKADGCQPVVHDFTSVELELETSKFAGEDKKACIVKKQRLGWVGLCSYDVGLGDLGDIGSVFCLHVV